MTRAGVGFYQAGIADPSLDMVWIYSVKYGWVSLTQYRHIIITWDLSHGRRASDGRPRVRIAGVSLDLVLVKAVRVPDRNLTGEGSKQSKGQKPEEARGSQRKPEGAKTDRKRLETAPSLGVRRVLRVRDAPQCLQ